LVLACAFFPFLAYFAGARGLSGEALNQAITPIAPLPTSLGFLGVFLVARRSAKRDGYALSDLGWRRPSLPDMGIALVAGVILVASNQQFFYPLIQTLRPAFDPTLEGVFLPAALVAFSIAAVGEDTLYRGYALAALEQRHGRLIAIVASSLFYALLVPGQGWPLNLWAFGFGIVLCGLRVWRKSLWVVVTVHWIVSCAPALAARLYPGSV
jgi:membrane protease YdiL (CAAX protease family)